MRSVPLNSNERPEPLPLWGSLRGRQALIEIAVATSLLPWIAEPINLPKIESGCRARETLQKQSSQIFHTEVKEPICLLQSLNERKSACLLFLLYKCAFPLNYFQDCPLKKKDHRKANRTREISLLNFGRLYILRSLDCKKENLFSIFLFVFDAKTMKLQRGM